jgi:hypothetical protein
MMVSQKSCRGAWLCAPTEHRAFGLELRAYSLELIAYSLELSSHA